jgi:hypothetical protein
VAGALIVFHSPSGTWPINRVSRSAPSEPHQIGADRSLVDEYQPGEIKHALLLDRTSARSGHICSLPFRGS